MISIREASRNLGRHLQRLDRVGMIVITRRSRPVAVLLSLTEYTRLTRPK